MMRSRTQQEGPLKGKKKVGSLTMEQLGELITGAVQQAVKEAFPRNEELSKGEESTNNRDEEEDVPSMKKMVTKDGEEEEGESHMVGRGLAGKMKELREEMRRVKNAKGQPFSIKKWTPLSREIVHDLIPANFCPARLPEYDERTDPEEHLGSLRTRPCCNVTPTGSNARSS